MILQFSVANVLKHGRKEALKKVEGKKMGYRMK